MKKLNLLIIPLLFILVACSSREEFSTIGTMQNMAGIWGTWNNDGNFEFYEILTFGHSGVLMNGYIRPEGEIGFIHVGGFHFHGLEAHAFFNIGMFNEGIPQEIQRHEYFTAHLTSDGHQMRITPRGSNNYITLNYMGDDPSTISHEVGHVMFLEDYNIEYVIDELWELFIEPEFD
ncbi:MAG: hypothetical protein FWF57_05570 [Defluviitaleaceae bacterium]|nr:hypothetical protein [Defluviitaleaceae bacterium]